MEDKFVDVQDTFSCTVERGSSVIRIILCDDDEIFLNKLKTAVESALQEMNEKAKIHTFNSLEDVGQPILASCDIAFLDIDFSNARYNGMEIARKLRSVRKDSIIIFVTNFIEYAPEGYEIQAFRYVLKLDVESKLKDYLQQAIVQLRSVCETLKIKVNGEIIDIPLKSILYQAEHLQLRRCQAAELPAHQCTGRALQLPECLYRLDGYGHGQHQIQQLHRSDHQQILCSER